MREAVGRRTEILLRDGQDITGYGTGTVSEGKAVAFVGEDATSVRRLYTYETPLCEMIKKEQLNK
jgi:hypothetical protein